MVAERARDCLPNPPSGIGAEPETALGIKFLYRADQAHVPFLNEVLHREAAVDELLRDADDQPEIRLDKNLFTPATGCARATGKSNLLVGREQGDSPNLLEPHPNRVVEKVSFAVGEFHIGETEFARRGFRSLVKGGCEGICGTPVHQRPHKIDGFTYLGFEVIRRSEVSFLCKHR